MYGKKFKLWMLRDLLLLLDDVLTPVIPPAAALPNDNNTFKCP
jgi:hypothetical protein